MKGSRDAIRVLVVDDNEDTATSLAYLFQSWGHQIQVVHDGPAAVAAARDFQPHVVLLDIGLPGLDGFEVARQLRLMPELRPLLIIGASGYSRAQDRRRALEAGIDIYLAKPFDPWRLEPVIAAQAETIPA
jgi:two-component system CheB/CheR fusion protein